MYSQNGNSSSGSQSPQPIESSHHPSRTIKRGSWAQSEEEDSEEEEESKPTFNKRKNSKASSSSNNAVNDMSSFDKDQRKLARMIRNRNAAQASRDRKKEYTQTLELRVAELESQLLPNSSSNSSNSQQINNINPPTQPTRQRQQKRSRSSSNTSDPLPTTSNGSSFLEEQNDNLRLQLYSEQMESARLRLKLESLEFKFHKMEELIPNNPVILPLHFSSFPSTTELSFQPIFSFSTTTTLLEEEEELDIKPIISYEDEPSSPSSSHSSMEQESIMKTLLPEQASLRILTRETTMQRKQTWKVKFSTSTPSEEFSIINQHDDYVSPPSSLPSSPSYSDDSYFSSNRSSITSLDINNSSIGGSEESNDIGAVFSEWVTGLDLDDDHVRIKKEEEDVTMEFFNFDLLNDESTSNTLVLC